MKKVIVAMALSMTVASMAMAEPVITTGSKKGSYIKVGHNLRGLIGGNVITSKGSIQNLDRIMSGEANVGIVQMDAYAWYTDKNPDAKHKIEIMGPIYEECVYMAVNSKGKVKSEDDLQSKGFTIAIGKKGSGTAVTWDYMRQLEPAYKASAVSYSGGVRALGKLASQPDGDVNAVMWVTKPVLTGKLAQTVLKSKELKFLNVNDKDLNDKYKPTGKPIYTFRSIEVKKGFLNDKEVKTICVDAAIVADADMDEDILEDISDVILNNKATLLK